MKTKFKDNRSWCGGFYELCIEVSPHSDVRLQKALDAIWQIPYLKGCYTNRNQEPEEQKAVKPDLAEYNNCHLQGIAILPDGQEIACGTVAIREKGRSDWLDFYVPLGALGQIYKEVGGYPFADFGSKSQSWRQPLEDWLAKIGCTVFSTVQFRLGLIGFEVSGTLHHLEMSKNDISEIRHIGYLWPTSEGIQYFSTNKWSD
jgi:hypothetical protein